MNPITDPLQTRSEIRQLLARIAELRKKHTVLTAGNGIAFGVVALCFYLAFEMIADRCFDFSLNVRALLFTAGLCSLGILAWRFSPVCKGLSDDQISRLVERALPEFQGRFLASIQLARRRDAGTSEAFVRILFAEAVELEKATCFDNIISPKAAKKAAVNAIAATLVFLGFFFFAGNPHLHSTLLQRALLSNAPIPRATRITAITGDQLIAIGDKLRIEATAEGVFPAKGKLFIQTASHRKYDFVMEPDSNGNRSNNRFFAILDDVQESFSYSVELNDTNSDIFKVTARPRPVVLSIDCEQVFPGYTHLPPLRRALNDLSLLAGSRLNLKVRCNSDIRTGLVKVTGIDGSVSRVTAEVHPNDPKTLIASVSMPPQADTARRETGFSVQLTDTQGIDSNDGVKHPFAVVPDMSPVIKFPAEAPDSVTVTPDGKLLIAFEAADDYGIGEMWLYYVLTAKPSMDGSIPKKGVKSRIHIPTNPSTKDAPRRISRRMEWSMDSLASRPEVGGEMEYWIEAVDLNDLNQSGGPGVGSTDHYKAVFVTQKEKQAELSGKLDETLRGLNNAASAQDALIHEQKSKNHD